MNVPGEPRARGKVRCQLGMFSCRGPAGCERSQAEDRGLISKRENESCIQSLGQLHAQ